MVGGRRATRSQTRLGEAKKSEPVPERKSPLRWANWSKALALLLVVVNVWLMYRFFLSSRFWVREVAVKGQDLVSADDVKNVAHVLDRSIFRVRASELEDCISEQFGCVEASSVRCELPCRVVITLKERQDVLVWVSGGKQWWVDRDGNVLGPTTDPKDRIVIRDIQAEAPAPKGCLVGVPWALAWDMAEALPAARSYDYLPNVGLVLRVTAHDWPIYLGYGGDAELKVTVMRELVQEFLEDGTRVEYIDVRNERRPSYGKS